MAFAHGVSLPPCSLEHGPYRLDPYSEFLRVLSLTFCAKCGLCFAGGRIGQLSACKGGHSCDLHPCEMQREADPARRRTDVRYYTTPDPSHWPRYDMVNRKYYMLSGGATDEEQRRESMFDLPAAEAECLAPLAINFAVGISRAGGAATVNMQKK